jgi:hypothetical protein
MGIELIAKTEAAKAKLVKIQAGLTPERIDPVVEEAARRTQAGLVQATPKKWFGQARAGWVQPASVIAPALGVRIVRWNEPPGITVPLMLFLEEGTKDHGPLNFHGPERPGEKLRKAALFIPLTRKAVNATQGIFGVGSVSSFREGKETYWETRKAIFQRTQHVRAGKVKFGSRALVYGVDYVLAKRVKGISARRIVASFRPKSQAILKGLMVTHVRNLLKS